MKSQFTPGPWERHDASVYAGSVIVACCPKNHWTAIELPEAEKLANARLIASAPELLAALENLVADWERVHGPVPEDHEARAAIAKAKGV